MTELVTFLAPSDRRRRLLKNRIHKVRQMHSFNFSIDSIDRRGAPNYRFFKLIFTAALRLKLELPVDGVLKISGSGQDTGMPVYKSRVTFKGKISFGSTVFDDIVFVVDQSRADDELITFWRGTQRGESAGSKSGAHPFAEAYIGYRMGKIIESQSFPPSKVVQISDEYNSDPKFNITAWIIKSAPPLREEPKNSQASIELPTQESLPEEEVSELVLLNKWRTDVLRSGVPWTNLEVDACIKNLKWSSDERILCDVHLEGGKFQAVKDFGTSERYASKAQREKVYAYLSNYNGNPSRARLILTAKGDSDEWLLASGTMLKRLSQLH